MSLPNLDLQIVEKYAWAAWSAIGVPGWHPDRFRACVDPEALLLLTAALGDRDPRLREGAVAWCASNLDLVSRSRLGGLLKRVPQAEP